MKCKWDKDIEVDLIMHGSPCQDFSLAGKQAGGDKDSGTRSSLMYETLRIVEKLMPKYVIWENVKNLLSKNHRHNFDAYLSAMEHLGYTNFYQVLNAKDYGIPQNRERVFTVSILNNGAVGAAMRGRYNNGIIEQHIEISNRDYANAITTVQKDSLVCEKNEEFIFPPKQELKLKLKDMLEDNVDEKYYLTETEKLTYNRDFGSKGKLQEKEYVDTLTASMGTGGGNVPILKIKNATKQGYLEATDGDGIDISSRMQYHRGNVQKDSIQTITTSGGNDRGVVENLRIRKLTPKECWRLMGFDDEDFEKAEKVNSNTQLYKQAGNSIVVNVLYAILKKLLVKEKWSDLD